MWAGCVGPEWSCLASYTPEDFADADFISLEEAAVYLAQHEPGPGPALQELIAESPESGRDITLRHPQAVATGGRSTSDARGKLSVSPVTATSPKPSEV